MARGIAVVYLSDRTENDSMNVQPIATPEDRGSGFAKASDVLIQLVREYALAPGEADRIRLAEEIFRRIEPNLRLFVNGRVSQQAAQDALQETLKALAIRLKTFRGDTTEEFCAWCYRIARNKIADHYRDKTADRIQPLPPEEIWEMMELSAQDAPISPTVRLDLEYAMKLLTNSKPECYDFLWKHFVFGLDYREIAAELDMGYDNVRMKIGRCLQAAKSLVS